MNRNLYRVTLRSTLAGPYYVVAETADAAVETVIADMNRRDYGFTKDRVLDRVELLAEQRDYPRIARLYVTPCPPSVTDGYGDGK